MIKSFKKSKQDYIFQYTAIAVVTIVTILCLVPFVLLITGSITKEEEILLHGFSFIPKSISFAAYKMVFADPTTILRAYGVTLFVTIVGTVTALFFTTMTAYVISR